MISVCYLSPSRRRRARSRWCWAPAPGGCWMWLGRERKTTKTTVWCTAKVSKQRRHPVISPQRNTPPPQRHWQSSIHSTLACLSLCLSLCLSFTFSPLLPSLLLKVMKRTQIIAFTQLRGHTKRHTCTHSHTISVLLLRVIYITKTLIKNWETSLDTQS